MLLLPFVIAALAAEPAHYHPDRVAAESALFAKYAEAQGPRFETLQRDLVRWSTAVEALERAVLLAGDRAGAEVSAWAEDTRRTLVHQYMTAQAHVGVVEDDSAETFGAALERALAPMQERYALTECASASSILSLAGPGGRGSHACDGENINGALGSALDADEALAAAVDEMIAIEWPAIVLTPTPQAAVPLSGPPSGEGAHLQLAALAEVLDADVLRTMSENLEDKLAPLDEALSAGDADALAEAEGIRARYEAAMAERGGQLLSAIEKPLSKLAKGGVALCLNPPELGGCPGDDLTAELAPALAADRKVQKALR